MKRAIINALIDAGAPDTLIPVFVSSTCDILDLPVPERRIPRGSSTLTQSIYRGTSRSGWCEIHYASGNLFYPHRRAPCAPLEVPAEI